MANAKELPPLEYLNECFTYEPQTGLLTWKKRPESHFKNKQVCGASNTRYAGKEAGTVNKVNGYRVVKLDGRLWAAHRISWALANNAQPCTTLEIDHLNHDRLDNRAKNLSLGSAQANMRNQSMRSTNTSGRIGVYWAKDREKWSAQIQVDGRTKYLGFFTTIIDAVVARIKAEKLYGYNKNHGTTVASNDSLHLDEVA